MSSAPTPSALKSLAAPSRCPHPQPLPSPRPRTRRRDQLTRSVLAVGEGDAGGESDADFLLRGNSLLRVYREDMAPAPEAAQGWAERCREARLLSAARSPWQGEAWPPGHPARSHGWGGAEPDSCAWPSPASPRSPLTEPRSLMTAGLVSRTRTGVLLGTRVVASATHPGEDTHQESTLTSLSLPLGPDGASNGHEKLRVSKARAKTT